MAQTRLCRNRKFLRLAEYLSRWSKAGGEIAAMGALELMWQTAYEAADERIGDAADVERAARWRGPRGELVAALLKAGGDRPGFIEPDPQNPSQYVIHDFWEHVPHFVAKRATRAADRLASGTSLSEVRQRAASIRWQREHQRLLLPPYDASGVHLHANGEHDSASVGNTQPNPIGVYPPLPPQGGVDAETKKRGSKAARVVEDSSLSQEEQRLVTYWREQCKRPKAKISELDLERLRAALGNTELAGEYDETCLRLAALAIKGCSQSPHHMGQNDTGAKYTSLSLIFRDHEHIRQFVDIARAVKVGGSSPSTFQAQRQREIDAEDAARPERKVITDAEIADLARLREIAAKTFAGGSK